MRKPRYLKNVPHFFEQILDPRTREKRKVQVIDATEELTAHLDKQDVWGSQGKGGTAGHLSKCIQDNGVGRLPGVYATQTTNSLLKVIFTDNIDVAIRYELPSDGKKVARINDDIKKGKKELLKLMPLDITYKPPRWNRSIECSQSEEMAELRAESKERRAGEEPGAYATPTESGFRDARRWYGRTAKR
jgi:hypothetical protein